MQKGKQHDQHQTDDSKHLDPGWWAGGRSAAGSAARVAIGVGEKRLFEHTCVLRRGWASISQTEFTIQSVSVKSECIDTVGQVYCPRCRSCGTTQSRRTVAKCARRFWTPQRPWWPSTDFRR